MKKDVQHYGEAVKPEEIICQVTKEAIYKDCCSLPAFQAQSNQATIGWGTLFYTQTFYLLTKAYLCCLSSVFLDMPLKLPGSPLVVLLLNVI